ncbi:DeoR family transcriptional regulator [Kaistia sp. 32K]|nr:DeoR family transcriptional regulator [Kaistia sp. 32K]
MPEQRRAAILALAIQEESLTVEDFAKRLGVSKETIRRDLRRLDRAGQLRRIHGGALAPQTGHEADLAERLVQNPHLKSRIASVAAPLFSSRDTLMIDAGTTTVAFASEIAKFDHLGIVTNSIEIAQTLWAGPGKNPVVVIGGSFRGDRSEITGPFAIEHIEQFSVDHVILTVGAIDLESGAVMDFDIDEAMIAKAMIKRAHSVTILADHTKFNKRAMATVCDLSIVDRIITDDSLDTRSRRKISHYGVELILS